jgi:pimeloyl-ACP methyl ester carboxylesterase
MTDGPVALPSVEGVTHRFLELDDLRMHVAEAGSGPPVLLLHGWPQHWYAWRKVIPLLAPHHRLICPDLRGFGWSEAPAGSYAKAELAQDVLALLDALELERVELLAHDWGAWIGFILCLEHPERFAHYMPLNIITPWPEPPSLAGLGAVARLWYQVTLALPLLGANLIRRTGFVRRLISAGAAHEAWSQSDLDIFADVLRAPERASASVHLYRTFLLHELVPFLQGRVGAHRLTVPTLMLHGTRDLAIDYRRLGQWESNADQMSLELRQDSGHFIAEELPEFVAERALALFAADPAVESSQPISANTGGGLP